MMHKISEEDQQLIRHKFIEHIIAERSAYPVAFVVAGAPAAGKTTFVSAMLKQGIFPKNAFLLSPDAVMESLPGYLLDLKKYGKKKAFRKWEMPARLLAFNMLSVSVEERYNIIIDMVGALPINEKILKQLKSAGYTIQMFWIDSTVSVSVGRLKDSLRYASRRMVFLKMRKLLKVGQQYRRLSDELTIIKQDWQLTNLSAIPQFRTQ